MCRCEHEIGSPAKGWRSCGKKAHYEVCHHYSGHVVYLYACKQHLAALLDIKRCVPSCRITHKPITQEQ